MTYPNLYREGPAYELYGDSEMYLKWRGPLREAARVQALQKLQPIFGTTLSQFGLTMDDALNQSLMWNLAFGSLESGIATQNDGATMPPSVQNMHRIFAHNLLELADAYRATLNMTAIHESDDSAMPEKVAQFLQRVDMAIQAGFNELANMPNLEIPPNSGASVSTPISDGKGAWLPVGALLALLSLLG